MDRCGDTFTRACSQHNLSERSGYCVASAAHHGEQVMIFQSSGIVLFCLGLSVIWLGTSLVLPAFGQSYAVDDLGLPSGFTNSSGAYSDPHGINNSGAVAGEWAPDANSQRAFFYSGGTNQDI